MNQNDDYFICGFHENDDENLSIATEDMVLKKNCQYLCWLKWILCLRY